MSKYDQAFSNASVLFNNETDNASALESLMRIKVQSPIDEAMSNPSLTEVTPLIPLKEKSVITISNTGVVGINNNARESSDHRIYFDVKIFKSTDGRFLITAKYVYTYVTQQGKDLHNYWTMFSQTDRHINDFIATYDLKDIDFDTRDPNVFRPLVSRVYSVTERPFMIDCSDYYTYR